VTIISLFGQEEGDETGPVVTGDEEIVVGDGMGELDNGEDPTIEVVEMLLSVVTGVA
jgi:hypothetical protein